MLRIATSRLAPLLGISAVAAAMLLAPPAARGQAGDQPAVPAEIEAQTVTVVVDGVELFRVRGSTSFPAADRAAAIARRVIDVGRDRSIDVSTIRVEDSEFGPRVTAGDGRVTIVTALQSDARLESLGQKDLAEIYRRRVSGAVVSYRELRAPARLKTSIAWLIAATVLLAGVWAAGRWAFRRLDRVIGRRLEVGVERLRIQSFRLLSPEQAWRLLRALLRGLRATAMLVIVYVYLNSTLSLFPWTRGFAIGMFDLVLDPLATMARGAWESVPNLVFLVVLTLVTRVILRLVRLFFDEIARGAVAFESFYPEWAMPTYRLVRTLIVAFAVVVAFPYVPGSGSLAFKSMSLFFGVLFSLGSSSVIGNIIAGYSMTYRRAFREGDLIRVGEVDGVVTRMRLLATHVRTYKNEDVVIPNSLILSSHVVNYSAYVRQGGLILHTTVGIGYEVPWRQVEAMLLMAARRTEGLSREPAPFVLQTALGDFAVTYELNAYYDLAQLPVVLYAELHRHILDVFNEYGVQIMTPAYRGDPPDPKVVPRAQWYATPAEPPAGSP